MFLPGLYWMHCRQRTTTRTDESMSQTSLFTSGSSYLRSQRRNSVNRQVPMQDTPGEPFAVAMPLSVDKSQ